MKEAVEEFHCAEEVLAALFSCCLLRSWLILKSSVPLLFLLLFFIFFFLFFLAILPDSSALWCGARQGCFSLMLAVCGLSDL